MKDHKENFNNNPTVRLMNNNCKVHSKDFLDTVNKSIPETTNLNQWRNAETVFDCFKAIHNKHLCKSVIFDIKQFYVSVTENLLKTSQFSSEHKHFFQMMTKQLFTTQENNYFLTIRKLRVKETVGYLISRLERTMKWRLINYSEVIYFTNYHNYTKKGHRVV